MRKYFWYIFLAFTLLVKVFFEGHPDWAEKVYSRGIFLAVRFVFDRILGWLPFPLTYLLFAFVAVKIGQGIWFWVRNRPTSRLQKLRKTVLQLGSWVCGIIALFYWLWGFNYYRIPLETQLSLRPAPVTTDLLWAALYRQTTLVKSLRTSLQPDSNQRIPAHFYQPNMEKEVQQTVQKTLSTYGFTASPTPRGRQPFWKGFLLRFGASGIYNPFTGECNMDRGLYFLSKPYVLAHEFGHGYGFGDEGACNFIAWLSLSQSENTFYRYSAALGFWRELASACRRNDPEKYAQFRAQLPAGWVDDLEQIYACLDRYPEYFEPFRRKAYDQYLKSQGIAEGMANYDKVIALVIAWEQRAGR